MIFFRKNRIKSKKQCLCKQAPDNAHYYKSAIEKTRLENRKQPLRTEIINFLLSLSEDDTNYLEIGVRNPDDNFNHIVASNKYSVDPGLEFENNPVDYKTTSDEFFKSLSENKILTPETRFDVVFIDGLHLAEQVDRDITNAFNYIKDNGFVVLHDCNPPTEWHAREEYRYYNSPARETWNGTTWKAFMKWRFNPDIYSCCIDTDWGVGILTRCHPIGSSINETNSFFEYTEMDKNRKHYLNLIEFDEMKCLLSSKGAA